MERYVVRLNRAVGIHCKGDTYAAPSNDSDIISLLGAGYADLVRVEKYWADNSTSEPEDNGDS